MADGPTWQPKPTGRHWLPCPALERCNEELVFQAADGEDLVILA